MTVCEWAYLGLEVLGLLAACGLLAVPIILLTDFRKESNQ